MCKVEITKHHGHKFLWIDDELQMSDTPFMKRTRQVIADQAYGDVLVAGYGLGLLHEMLEHNPKVNEVVTIEKHMGVIDANKLICGRNQAMHRVICTDFFDFIPRMAKINHIDEYDCVIGDIWLEAAPDYLDVYRCFKEHAERMVKSGGKIFGWCSDYFEYLIAMDQQPKDYAESAELHDPNRWHTVNGINVFK